MDWKVFHIKNFPFAKPPKDKFLLVFQYENIIKGFPINSSVPTFIKSKKLLPCIAPICSDSNTFLDHDSFIDCTSLFDIENYYLYNEVCDEICDLSKHYVIKAILACRVLSSVEKMTILKAHQTKYFNLDLEKNNLKS